LTVKELDGLIKHMRVSTKKIDITPEVRGISMLGFGNPHNIVKGVETPINSRVIAIEDDNKNLIFFISMEICFITDSLYYELTRFAHSLNPKSIVLSMAQHTHSAPSGYDHYALYNMPTPGFVPKVLAKYLDQTKLAMQEAFDNLSEGSWEYCDGKISTQEDVSFNRSMPAYLNNPEVLAENLPTTSRSAVDKTMRLIKVKDKDDKLIASMNWFAVHATNIPNTNFYISPDNKGYASLDVEKHIFEKEHFEHVALFNQGCAGDVSPNFLKSADSGMLRGKYVNPFDSAKYNGSLQSTKCIELIAENATAIPSQFEFVSCYRDFSNIRPDKKFLPKGAPDTARTTEPCHGVAFIQGTKDGPGIHPALGFLVKILAQVVKYIHIILSFTQTEKERSRVWNLYRNQAPKSIFVNSGEKNILGISNLSKLPLPAFIDPLMGILKGFHKKGALKELSWTQKVMPVQLIKTGHYVIAALPGEVTTIAGLRFKRQIEEFFGEGTIAIISPYSNAFCGYIVTPEEYEMQLYEGGHTVFGKWTLPAFQTVLEELCVNLRDKTEPQTIEPPKFSKEELELRTNNI
jgi:neutral ceramidase